MSKLGSLLKDTVIYGVSSIVGRFLNYLLVPLYTAKMSVESGEYGVVTNMYAWTAFILVVLIFGMETTFFRFADKQKGNVSQVFSMCMQVIGVLCVLFLAGVFLNIGSLAELLGYAAHPEFITMMAVVVALDALQTTPFGLLRFQGRPIKFASLKLLNIFANIALNLLFFLLLPWLYAKNPDAVKYDEITYAEVLAKRLMVMDSTATSLSMDNHMPIILFALKDPENIYRVVMGEKIGTLVTSD